VAAWPPVHHHSGGPGFFSMSLEGRLFLVRSIAMLCLLMVFFRIGTRILAQTYAIESSTFVIHTTALISEKGIKAMGTGEGTLMNIPGGGSSAIFGPDGRKLTEDLPENEENLVIAEVNPDKVLETRCFVDSCGHYSRPDLLWLGVDLEAKKHVRGVQ